MKALRNVLIASVLYLVTIMFIVRSEKLTTGDRFFIAFCFWLVNIVVGLVTIGIEQDKKEKLNNQKNKDEKQKTESSN